MNTVPRQPYLYQGDAPDICWSERSNAVTLQFYGSIPKIQYFVRPVAPRMNDLIGVPPEADDCQQAALLEITKVDNRNFQVVVKVVGLETCLGCSLETHPTIEMDAVGKLPFTRLRTLDHDGFDRDSDWQPNIRFELRPK